TIEGEFARKRRMMSHGWPIMLTGGRLSPPGYAPVSALMIVSPPVLRSGAPAAAAARRALLRVDDRRTGRRAAGLAGARNPRRLGGGARHPMIKRAFDLVVGTALSIVTAPLVAALALLIALESRAHPIYTQTRVGQDGRP